MPPIPPALSFSARGAGGKSEGRSTPASRSPAPRESSRNDFPAQSSGGAPAPASARLRRSLPLQLDNGCQLKTKAFAGLSLSQGENPVWGALKTSFFKTS